MTIEEKHAHENIREIFYCTVPNWDVFELLDLKTKRAEKIFDSEGGPLDVFVSEDEYLSIN